MASADAFFARMTAVLLAAGLLVVAAGLGRGGPAPFLLAAGVLLGLPGLLQLMRQAVPAWRPLRTRAFTVHLAYVALFVLPSAWTAARPGRSLLLAGGVLLAYFSFHACREAFSRDPDGLCSPRGFLAIAAATAAALPAFRLAAGASGLAPSGWAAALAGDFTGPARDFDRLFDALLVGFFPPLALRCAVEESPAWRRLWEGGALLAAAGILLAYGRSAWLALLLEIALLLALVPAGRRRLAALLAALALALLLLPGGGERARSIVRADHPTNSQRLEQWAAALELTLRSPLLGNGLGSFGEGYRRLGGSYSDLGYDFPHNLPLHLAAECGLPALFLFLAWMWWLFTGWETGWGKGGGGPGRPLAALRLSGKIAAAGLLLFSFFDL